MMQSLPLTFSRLFPIWRNPFTYHISAGFLTVLTIRFILTVSATPVTIFFCLTGICASQPSGAVPGTHSIFRLPSTQHGLRNSLAFHPKAVCSVPILTCTIFHLSALSMKVPITVPSATRRKPSARLSGRHHCCPEGSVGNRPHLAGSYSRTARGIHRFHALFRSGI